MAHESFGIWLWSDAISNVIHAHHVSPGDGFIEHCQAHGFVALELTAEQAAEIIDAHSCLGRVPPIAHPIRCILV